MTSTARKMHAPVSSPSSVKPNLRLVDSKPTRAKSLKIQERQRAFYLRITFAVVVVVVGLALVSTGSVWMLAESTRLSKISSVKQQLVYEELGHAQELTVALAAAQSAARIEKIARRELGMVASTGDVTYVVLESPKVVNPKANVQSARPEFMTTLAELTVGEASTLLVGDLGITAVR